MLMLSVPVSPASSPVPESGTTMTESAGHTTIHASRVLQYEAARASLERARDLIDGHITRRALDGGARGQHVPAGRSVQIAAEFLGEQETPQHGIRRYFGIGQRLHVTSKLPAARFMSAVFRLRPRLEIRVFDDAEHIAPRIEHVGHANALAHILDLRARLGAELEQTRIRGLMSFTPQ